MEHLHPVAQVTLIIVIGIVSCFAILSLFTSFFDRINSMVSDKDLLRVYMVGFNDERFRYKFDV